MNSFQLIQRVIFVLCVLGTVTSGICQTKDVLPTLAKFGILPASVLRNESTVISVAQAAGLSSKGWAGLVCGAARCELRPVRLDVSAASDGRVVIVYPQAGRRKPVKGEYTIALVRGFSAKAQATVPTWFTLRTPRSPADIASGSLGVSLQVPGQSDWRMVPRWALGKDHDFLTFYLESGRPGAAQRRQVLGRVSLEAVDNGIKPRDVLIWAGDLDGDGKMDLITRTGPNSAQPGLQLWLSGQAKGEQLVAPVAELTNWTDVEEAEGC